VIAFDDGGRLALDDPRALSGISLCDLPDDAEDLAPDALVPWVTGPGVGRRRSARRCPVKVGLLDRASVGGCGDW
jgi:hypothetical protein